MLPQAAAQTGQEWRSARFHATASITVMVIFTVGDRNGNPALQMETR